MPFVGSQVVVSSTAALLWSATAKTDLHVLANPNVFVGGDNTVTAISGFRIGASVGPFRIFTLHAGDELYGVSAGSSVTVHLIAIT